MDYGFCEFCYEPRCICNQRRKPDSKRRSSRSMKLDIPKKTLEWTCVCGKTFSSARKLKQHQKTDCEG